MYFKRFNSFKNFKYWTKMENLNSDLVAVTETKAYEFTLDRVTYRSNEKILTGRLILKIAGKTPSTCYSLYQKLKGCDFGRISLDEKVDLSNKGIDEFVTKEPEGFEYFLDKEPEMTNKKALTANEILKLGNVTQTDHYLILKKSDGTEVKYIDNPDEPIKMDCKGMNFTSMIRTPTTVS